MMMLTGSVFTILSLSGTLLLLFISTLVLTTLQPSAIMGPAGNGDMYSDCRATDNLSPWITRVLFTLFQLSYSIRYLIALLSWLSPLLILFLLPVAFILFIYVSSLALQLYIIRHWLTRQLSSSSDHASSALVLRRLLQRLLAALWHAHGQIFHGYEICGSKKLPKEGPAFLIYYHGTLPLDVYYFIAYFLINNTRIPIPVVDRFLFRIPGIQRILDLIGAVEGSVDECTQLLTGSSTSVKKAEMDGVSNGEAKSDESTSGVPGGMVILSPGGVREALFADEYYSVVWGKRRGFARVAIQSNQPIYPVFTENIREGIHVVQYGKSWWRYLYELTRWPIAIFYGYFPVKLRTYIGDPIYPRESETAEELADRVKLKIEDMIAQHQWLPGSIVIGILQRFPWFDNWVRLKNSQRYAARK